MNTIENTSKEIALLLEQIQTNNRQKAQLKIKMEEIENTLTDLREKYESCEEKIRSAKYQISEMCDKSHLMVLK